jgi:hypothetical protein
MNFAGTLVERCPHCGWSLRMGDIPAGRTVNDVLWVHRHVECEGRTNPLNDAVVARARRGARRPMRIRKLRSRGRRAAPRKIDLDVRAAQAGRRPRQPRPATLKQRRPKAASRAVVGPGRRH